MGKATIASRSAPQTPRLPLSPSTTVSPLLTPGATFKLAHHEKRQAKSILSQLSSQSPMQHQRMEQRSTSSRRNEAIDYFSANPAQSPSPHKASAGGCTRKSDYFSFPDFEAGSQHQESNERSME